MHSILALKVYLITHEVAFNSSNKPQLLWLKPRYGIHNIKPTTPCPLKLMWQFLFYIFNKGLANLKIK